MTSIRDVAAAAGVGVGTVSRVLNDSPHVSPETRVRVEAAIARLGYQPNLTARALSLGRSTSICVVVAPLDDPGVTERLAGAVEVLSKGRFELVLSVAEKPEDVARIVDGRSSLDRAAGILFLGVPVAAEAAEGLLAAEVPAAVSGSVPSILAGSWADGTSAVRMATEHLIGLGHREIALVQHQESAHPGQAPRRQGHLDALRAVGARPRIETDVDPKDPARRKRIEQLISPSGGITAVATTSDDLAYAVLAGATAAGCIVPDDVSVVGSGDLAPSAYVGLTTVREDLSASAAWAAEQLLRMIDGTVSEPTRMEVQLELVVRDMTGPPPRPVS
ncbi:MAG: LacI family DNA-binding transcriptional regulator [Acidimicrobiia bacterium]